MQQNVYKKGLLRLFVRIRNLNKMANLEGSYSKIHRLNGLFLLAK
jgi:hypothetical protein